jgi:hypothetical protein
MEHRFLPFRADQAVVNTDIDEQAREFAQLAPISEFSCLPGRQYRSEWVAASANEVTIIAGSASAHRQRQDAMKDLERISLFIPIKGTHTFQSQGQQVVMHGSESMLFYPPIDRTYETSDMAAILIQVNASSIAKRTLETGGHETTVLPLLGRLQQPAQFSLNEPLNKHIFSTIRKALTVINAMPSTQVELPALSGVDAVIEKCLVALLFPELVV